MSISKKKKQDILPDDITANIYDKIELIVDFHGITRLEIENAQEKVKQILSSDYYSRREGEFSVDELKAYGERTYISNASLKRYYDTEGVIRYYSKDETEIITISKLFLSITLNYEVTHKLKDNISLMAQLIELFAEEEYFEVEGVYLIKRDSIYSESTSIGNRFKYGKYNVNIEKSVVKGYTSYGDEIYEGKMDTIVSCDTFEEVVNLENMIKELNNISFEVFISHITEGFANDLIVGKTDKVIDGVNINE